MLELTQSEKTVPGRSNGILVKQHPLLIMVALMVALNWALSVPAVLQSYGLLPFTAPVWLGFLAGITPVIAAFTVAGIVDGREGIVGLLRRLLRWRVGAGWHLLALLGGAVAILCGVGLYITLTGDWPVLPVAGLSIGDILATFGSVMGLGILFNTAEIAWTGVALPRLQNRYGVVTACILLAIPEALFYLPLLATNGSIYQHAGLFAFGLFTLARVFIMAWVYNSTQGSIFVVVLMHAASDAWSRLLTTESILTPFYLTTGLLCAAALIIAGRSTSSSASHASVILEDDAVTAQKRGG